MGDQQIVVAVVVDVADANALSPTGMDQAGAVGHILELEAAEIAIQVVPRSSGILFETIGVDEQDIL